MPQLSLFDDPADRQPQAERLAPKLSSLAGEGLYFGTSSWKYEGWLGSIYTPGRYEVRGKLSTRKFQSECLREYASTFPIVGGDFSFYQFPSADYWSRLFRESPDSLLFGLKIPEDLTVALWPTHARYGTRAGTLNEHFLDPTLLEKAFLRPLHAYTHRIAVLMFEFGTLPKKLIATPAEFVARLDGFLSVLPRTFRFAIEIRNPEFLGPRYFDALAAHNVAHVFNAWTRMPELDAQIEMPGVFTADFSVVRALLAHGRTYEDAVGNFQPYDRIQAPLPRVRAAMVKIAARARERKEPYYAFINNRLEGNAPTTIEAIIGDL